MTTTPNLTPIAVSRPTREALERRLATADVADDPVLANALRIDFAVAHGVDHGAIERRDPDALAATHVLVA